MEWEVDRNYDFAQYEMTTRSKIIEFCEISFMNDPITNTIY